MDVSFFIAKRIRFKGKMAMVSISVSFLVMIIAVAVSSGFRHEIRDGISSVSGDVQLVSADMNWIGESSPVSRTPSWLDRIRSMPEVGEVSPAVYRVGILKSGDNIHGVIFRGTEQDSSLAGLGISVPFSLASMLGISVGDELPAYFVGERVKVRKFIVKSLYDSMLPSDDEMLIRASLEDMQRVNGWSEDEVSAIELRLHPSSRSVAGMEEAAAEAGSIAMMYSSDDEPAVVAVSSVSRYPQLFDWLNLIDFNVLFILVLMTAVAGFNMISGLLIMLFENIPTIGVLKSLGMTDRAIAKIFLSASSSIVLKGMAAGNLLALAFCLVQGMTRVLKLDPTNYFVSFVPVHVDLPLILAADLAAYVIIMILLLIPSLFISGIDPAKTVRVG